MKIVKYLVWISIMVWGTTTLQAKMKMNMDGLKLMPYVTAKIENNNPLSNSDIENFMTMMDNVERNKEVENAMTSGGMQAANVLKPGVSYDTYVTKSIELSGQKTKLDSMAKEYGYNDAVSMMITTTKIIRSVMSIQMEEKFAKMPKEQQAMARSMMGGMMGTASPKDIATVKPYASKLMAQMEKAGEGR